jgi:WD40 repeat protein
VWDTVLGTEVTKLKGNFGVFAWSVAVSADGSRIYAGDIDGSVRIWDGASGAKLGEQLQTHRGWVSSLAVSADSALLVSYSSSWPRVARVWEVASRKCVRTISDGVPEHATSAQLLAAAGLVTRVSAQLSVEGDMIMLTPQGGGSATCLVFLDTRVDNAWVFDDSRRVLWVGLYSGGPFRIALVE